MRNSRARPFGTVGLCLALMVIAFLLRTRGPSPSTTDGQLISGVTNYPNPATMQSPPAEDESATQSAPIASQEAADKALPEILVDELRIKQSAETILKRANKGKPVPQDILENITHTLIGIRSIERTIADVTRHFDTTSSTATSVANLTEGQKEAILTAIEFNRGVIHEQLVVDRESLNERLRNLIQSVANPGSDDLLAEFESIPVVP